MGEVSLLVVQEVMHQRARRTGDRDDAAARARQVGAMCTVHLVDEVDLATAIGLYEQHDRLDAADALHAAVARRTGVAHLVSADTAFAAVDGIGWLRPDAAEASLLN